MWVELTRVDPKTLALRFEEWRRRPDANLSEEAASKAEADEIPIHIRWKFTDRKVRQLVRDAKRHLEKSFGKGQGEVFAANRVPHLEGNKLSAKRFESLVGRRSWKQ